MSERKVVCRCGREMVLNTNARNSGTCAAGYVCECGWKSPIGRAINDMELAIERAYLAATATPPNPPLTREQVEALDDLDAVWVDEMGIKCFVESGEWAKDFLNTRRLQGYCMFKWFARKPTPADISAARAEKGASEWRETDILGYATPAEIACLLATVTLNGTTAVGASNV